MFIVRLLVQHTLIAEAFGEECLHMRCPGGASGHETDKMSPSSPPGTAPAADSQGILSVVPASGAVVKGNDVVPEDALAALTNIEDNTIQGERVLAYDNQLKRVANYREADQFATGQPR